MTAGETRTCKTCGVDKPLTDYARTGKSQRRHYCKACFNAAALERYAALQATCKPGERACRHCRQVMKASLFTGTSTYCWQCSERKKRNKGSGVGLSDERKFQWQPVWQFLGLPQRVVIRRRGRVHTMNGGWDD